MANTLRFKRGLVSTIPTALAGEPLFTTDTFDLYIGNGTGNTRFQKYIASGTTGQLLRGDGSLLTMPIVLTSPSNGQVLKYNGTSWVNDSDAGITGSGANGQVAYFTGATTQSGSNNLFWDATNGRLGVGLNNPSVRLHVNGAIYNQTGFILNRSDNFGIFTGASDDFGILHNGTNSILSNATGDVIFENIGTQRARITSTGNFIINNASTDNGLRFQVTGDGYFSGSVGIGTSTLTGFNLRIAKNITGGAIQKIVNQDGTVQSDVTNLAFGFLNSARTAAAVFTLPNYYHFYAEQYALGAGSIITNQFGFVADNTLTGATNNYGFYGNIASGTGRWNLYMNGTAANYLNGDLGIGVTTPSTALHIARSSAGNPIGMFVTNTGASTLNNSSDIWFGNWAGASTTNIYNARISALNTNAITAATALLFYTYNGSGSSAGVREGMRLDASGNLGLGVVPSAWSGYGVPVIEMPSGGTFIGQGSVNIGSNWYYSGSSFLYKTSSNASYYSQNSGQHRWFNAPSGTAGNAITFTQAMTLDASGNLGIGTASPAGRLEVNGLTFINNTGDTTARLLLRNTTTGASAGGLDIREIGVDTSINNASNGNMYFSTNNSERVRIFAGGNVGIATGASDSGERLQVNGTMRVSGASTFGGLMTISGSATTLMQITSTGSAAYIGMGDSSGSIVYLGSDDGSFLVQTPGSSFSNKLVINSAGAATFSSSVTAASFIPTSSTIPTNGMYLSAVNTLAFATASGNKLTISSTGLATFSDSARFSNQKGCIFVQTGGSLLGSISMDTANQVTLDNNGFAGLSVGGSYTMTGGNLGIGQGGAAFGSGTRVISVLNGTAPSSSVATSFLMYSANVTTGNAAPHFRTENGAVIKLYQETTAVGNAIISLGGGNAVLDDTTFDGYTLRQIVRALRNQGILQ